MFKTLYAKLAAVLVVLLGTLGVGYGIFTFTSTQYFLQEVNQRFNRDLARQLLVQRNLFANESLDAKAIKELFSYYMHINPAIEIYLLDADGNIIAFEAPEMKIKRRKVDLTPIKHFLNNDRAYPILGDDPRHKQRHKIFSAAAFPTHGPARQYLYVVLGGEDYDTAQSLLDDSYFLQISTTAVVVSIAFGLLAGLFIFNILTRRLRHLTGVMERFRQSDFREHEAYGRKSRNSDEIERLGGTYDEMAQRIIEQMQALEDKDTLRRNLVANVSHDLRTPLASLRGYLETLQIKTKELSTEERDNYLQQTLRQAEYLTHLVDELFELSKLDAHEGVPQAEPLQLGELVQDMAQKYQLATQQKSIHLEVMIAPELPLVEADIGMLARVLENLLSNALQHTDNGGRITVEVAAEGNGVRTTISNSGAGIPAQALPHLFERFYQSPERRHSGGAGLGLAIVKRILELHGSDISVTSEPNKETRFSFRLQQRVPAVVRRAD